MNKQEFVSNVAERIDADCTQAGNVVNAVFEALTQVLAAGDRVVIPGFGTFSTATRAARTGRNPINGEAIEIPARTVPTFKPGKALRDAVDS